ncbi:MAG: glycosyltransferase family 2 protein [Chlamydiota bacterium]
MNKRSMKNNPLVYVVTPIFNGRNHTEEYLQSLKGQEYKNFKVVIVDDGSTDGTGKMVREKFPDAILLEGDGSLWWSGGTNIGVKYAIKNNADFILTINHDVTLKTDYLTSLVNFAQEKKGALIGSMVVSRSNKGRVWFFGGGYNKIQGTNTHVTGKIRDFKVATKSLWLTGMGVLVPSSVFKEIGYYDEENFPLYFGDADFSERARRAGHELWVSPKSKVFGDTDDNWVGRNIRYPKPRFIYDLFTLTNSPFQLKTRSLYYKRYWPGNYLIGLLCFYTIGSANVYLAYIIGLARGVLRPKRKESV